MFGKKSFIHGLALFSMFFGAGNVVFPLIVGQKSGASLPYALIGLMITAVIVPFLGLYAVSLYGGNARAFFARLGRKPAFGLTALLLSLMGPFGGIPRCMTLSHSALKVLWPSLSLGLFAIVAPLLIFFFLRKRGRFLEVLGGVLTPLLLLSIGTVIIKGFLTTSAPLAEVTIKPLSAFIYGLVEGYQTMDLLAAFFFATLVCARLNKEDSSPMGAFLVGGILIALVYIGFGHLASRFGGELYAVPSENLLPALGGILLGERGQAVVSAVIGLSCLTTALALAAICSDFIKDEVFKGRLSSKMSLIVTLIASSLTATLEFSGIARVIAPLLTVIYPGLLILTLINIFLKPRFRSQSQT